MELPAQPELTDTPGPTRSYFIAGPYLAWLAPQALSESTKALSRLFLRVLLEENRRYQWLQQVPAGAVLYADEVRSPRGSLPRFIPEFVMTQLESETNLALLRPNHRNLLVLLSETGLRSEDGCSLPLNPVVTDSAGWPCLRFHSRKMRAEHLLPLSPRAAEAISTQQRRLSEATGTSVWLFPSRSDPDQPLPYDTARPSRDCCAEQHRTSTAGRPHWPRRATHHNRERQNAARWQAQQKRT